MISAIGVRHSPDRIAGLVDVPTPTSAGELQQFVCAVNWMRNSLPEYSALAAPLYEVLEAAAVVARSRKKTQLQRVMLASVGWNEQHERSLAAVKTALLQMVSLVHPKAEWEVCVFTDASQTHWGAVVTQIPPSDLCLELDEQHHEPLAFLSGRFTGASSRWAIIDKEAYAIVAAFKRLMYLLLRPHGFRIFTDHRNLQYIFDPLAVNSALARHQVDRLQRWAMTLTMFSYIIEHVSGEKNVWGDLLSRWGASPRSEGPPARMSALLVVDRVSPLQDETFIWPRHEELVAEQNRELAARLSDGLVSDCQWSEEREIYLTPTKRIWVPASAVDLQSGCVWSRMRD